MNELPQKCYNDINQNLLNMKKLLITLSLLLGLAISARAEVTYSYEFGEAMFSANGTVALGEVEWTLDGDGGYWGYDNNSGKGQQLGSGGKPYKSMTLSTTGIEGKVSSITVNTSGASSTNAELTVSVGGTQFGDAVSLTNSATDYTFTGSGEGEIILSYSQTSAKAIYIKSISVTYEPGEVAPTLDVPTFSVEEGVFIEAFELTLSASEGATIMYGFDNATWAEYTAPVTIPAQTTTVYAYATQEGYNNSRIVSVTYTYADSSTFIDYELVTNASQLTAGAKYIIASSADVAVAMSIQNNNNRGQEEVIFSDGILKYNPASNVTVFKLQAGNISDTYAFYDAAQGGYLYAASSSSNHLKTETTLSDNSSAAISVTSAGVATVKFQGTNVRNWLRYNSSSSLFSCYAETSSQGDVYLYKEVTGEEPELESPQIYYFVDGEETSHVIEDGTTFYQDINVFVYAPESAQKNELIKTYNGISETYSPENMYFTISATDAPGEYTLEAISYYANGQTTSAKVSFSVVTPIVVNYPKLDPTNVKEGRYIIAYTSPTTSYILKNESTGYYVVAEEFDLTGEALPSTDYIFEIVQGESGYTIKNADGTYLAMVVSGSYTNLKVQQTDAFEWTFTGTADAVQATGDGMEKFIYYSSKYNNFGAGTSNSTSFYPVFYRISDTPRDPLAETVPAVDGYVDIIEDYIENYYPEFDFTIASNYSDQIMVTAETDASIKVDAMKLVINGKDEVSLASADGIAFSGTSTSEYTAGMDIQFYFELTMGDVTVRTQTYEYEVGGETMTSICIPTISNNDATDVYSIDGIRVLRNADTNAINALPKGIYIVKGRKVIVR